MVNITAIRHQFAQIMTNRCPCIMIHSKSVFFFLKFGPLNNPFSARVKASHRQTLPLKPLSFRRSWCVVNPIVLLSTIVSVQFWKRSWSNIQILHSLDLIVCAGYLVVGAVSGRRVQDVYA